MSSKVVKVEKVVKEAKATPRPTPSTLNVPTVEEVVFNAYCVRERKKCELINPHPQVKKNKKGRTMLQGKCKSCELAGKSTKMNLMVKQDFSL